MVPFVIFVTIVFCAFKLDWTLCEIRAELRKMNEKSRGLSEAEPARKRAEAVIRKAESQKAPKEGK